MKITIYGWSTSEGFALRPPSSRPFMIGPQGELTQGPAVRQTDRRRPLRQGPIGFPTGWPPRKWLVRLGICSCGAGVLPYLVLRGLVTTSQIPGPKKI
jgi:hypothetical protein